MTSKKEWIMAAIMVVLFFAALFYMLNLPMPPDHGPDQDLVAFMNFTEAVLEDGDCANDWLTHMSSDEVMVMAVNWALRNDLCDDPEYYIEGWLERYRQGE